MSAGIPEIDPGARQRLTARFGAGVEAWLDELPALLSGVAEKWGIELGSPFPRGSFSTVFRCRTRDGRRAVLKASPDRTRLAREAAGLRSWDTVHRPEVIAFSEAEGALLMEAIEPGTPLITSSKYPSLESVVELVNSLHAAGVHRPSFPPLADHVAYLFSASATLYKRYPALTEVISPELYEHERSLAARMAAEPLPTVLLHGDLTPSNVLEGNSRGLVAIDPAPCLGDAAFDAIDLVLWQAEDLITIEARIERLAMAGLDGLRILSWCSAFAGMNALELASQHGPVSRIDVLIEVALRAKTV